MRVIIGGSSLAVLLALIIVIHTSVINKSVRDAIRAVQTEDIGVEFKAEKGEDIKETISRLTDEMLEFASKMEFEKAAEARDKIKELEKLL